VSGRGETDDHGDGRQPATDLDWAVYSDATFAGLSILIPVPLVDVFFEQLFRRRMPRAIAAHRGCTLHPETIRQLNRGSWGWAGCLLLPVRLVLLFLKRLFRTVFYFLTIKESTDLLSEYWHRAYLIDHGVRAGHLDDPRRRGLAVAAIKAVLDDVATSPLTMLAEQVVRGMKHALRTIVRWARGGIEDEVARATRERFERHWSDVAAYFEELGRRYETRLAELGASAEGSTARETRSDSGPNDTPAPS
jgi:hypothetical protein